MNLNEFVQSSIGKFGSNLSQSRLDLNATLLFSKLSSSIGNL